jgi:hypothetical protein
MARLQQKKQAAVTTGSADNTRPSLRDGFNGLYVLSPVRRAFWPPSPARRVKRVVANLIPASEYQDHTTSPSVNAPLVGELLVRFDALTSIASRAPRP